MLQLLRLRKTLPFAEFFVRLLCHTDVWPPAIRASSHLGRLLAKVMALHLPTSTYRLQFNHNFTLKQANGLIDYLSDLGITDCYASPLTLAHPGSLHGYMLPTIT